MSRGNNKNEIFLDDADRHGFLTALAAIGEHHSWRTLSYCLMPNHFHLLIESDVQALSAGMRDLLGGYARRFNRRHDLVGHVFGGRFRAVPVSEDRQVAAVLRYIAMNPVAAGLCRDPVAWPWSSFAATLGRGPRPIGLDLDRVWQLTGGNPERSRDLLLALVAPVPGT